MATTKDIESGPKIRLSIIVLAAIAIIGYGMITLVFADAVSGLIGLVFLVFVVLAWGIWIGLYQSRAEAHSKK